MNTTTAPTVTNHTTMSVENSTASDEPFLQSNLSTAPGLVPAIVSSYEWMPNLSFTLACLLLALGLFGNVLTLTITSRSADRWKPYNMLIMLLAAADTLSMLTRIISLLGSLQMNLISFSNYVFCQLVSGTSLMVRYSSTVIIEIICIERFLVIVFPLRARGLVTTRNTAITATACLLVTLASAIVVTVYSYGCRRESTANRSTDEKSYALYVGLAKQIITVLFQFIPIVVLLSLTPVMVIKLFRQNAIRRHLTDTESNIGHFRISVLLLAVVIAYIILEIVPTIVILSFAANDIAILGNNSTFGSQFFKMVLHPLAHMLNCSTNFIIYNAVNADFRRKTLIMLGLSRCTDQKCQKESIQLTNVSSE